MKFEKYFLSLSGCSFQDDLQASHCIKSVRIRSYSGPHFSHIFPHSDQIRRDHLSVFSPNAEKCEKNADENNSEYGHFLRSVKFYVAILSLVSSLGLTLVYDIRMFTGKSYLE